MDWMRLGSSWISGSRFVSHGIDFQGIVRGGCSAFHFQIGLLGRFNGRRRFATLPGALLPDVMSHASSCKQQRRERDEKDN